MAAGSDTIIQKATTGKVDWGQVAISGTIGGVTGAGAVTRLGMTSAKAVVAQSAIASTTSGFAMGNYHYFTGPGPHDLTTYATTVGSETLTSAGLGVAGGTIGHAIGGKIMGALTHNPQADTMALGRDMVKRVIPYADANDYGYYKAVPRNVFTATKFLLGEDVT